MKETVMIDWLVDQLINIFCTGNYNYDFYVLKIEEGKRSEWKRNEEILHLKIKNNLEDMT